MFQNLKQMVSNFQSSKIENAVAGDFRGDQEVNNDVVQEGANDHDAKWADSRANFETENSLN